MATTSPAAPVIGRTAVPKAPVVPVETVATPATTATVPGSLSVRAQPGAPAVSAGAEVSPAPPSWRAGDPVTTLGAKLSAFGAKSVAALTALQYATIRKKGVGPYCGDNSPFAKLTPAEQQAWVAENCRSGQTPVPAASIKRFSRLGWAMENLKAAYEAVGRGGRWAEVEGVVKAGREPALALASELAKDLWTGVYFNRGSAGAAQTTLPGVTITDRLTDYAGPNRDTAGLAKLNRVSFFFGVDDAQQAFIGRAGRVSELETGMNPDSRKLIHEEPLDKSSQKAGVLMFPPGVWNPSK
jgi:hypothetical protein